MKKLSFEEIIDLFAMDQKVIVAGILNLEEVTLVPST